MKVAIIGAGIAGLSCAIVLERNGIIPDVFEKNGFIGDREPHVGADLNIINRPVKDMIKYVKEKCGIDIKPLNAVNLLTHYSPNESTTIKGNFGYFLVRGKEENSLKGQLYSQLKRTPITFNIEVNYKNLINEYDFVVAADGKPDIAEELSCFKDWIKGFVKGAVIEGSFNPNELVMWINHTYCKNGYAYLTPYNEKRASLELYVPDVDKNQLDYYWDLFLSQEGLRYKIIETFKVKHTSGDVYPHRVNNIFLAGNTGGAIDPFLGFGALKSVYMGAMAAKAIVDGTDYEELIKDIYTLNLRLYEFRKAFNRAGHNNYDLLVKLIGFPGVKPIIYDTPINVIKYGATVLRMRDKVKGRLK
ncbi:hypothetical protein OXPF_18910 [Oxobacter pfennigii]|uniref:Uncharacterized protein n=1 Tax=Oxobacter pfennigii TaxID=36849 RepID=A0A0P9AH73_9CLOT|nr:NAD(P)-binding protein [Oxobacter pfennigii]KPU44805.1 hypothetical protein OXPF_18910 [Oxobacter pfennigii]